MATLAEVTPTGPDRSGAADGHDGPDVHDAQDPESGLAQVLRMAASAEPRCGAVTVIAVDGPSAAGKTTLSGRIAAALDVPTVHMDAIYPGWDGLADAVPLVTSQVLEPLARGERAAYRRWDWMRGRWGRTVEVTAVPLMVLEGVGSSVGTAGEYASVRVWVEANRDVRFARGIARDGEAYRPNWERWALQEGALFAADGTRDRADVLIDTSRV